LRVFFSGQAPTESRMPNDRFVAVGLLTQRDLEVLGSGFRRAFPLNDTTDFTSLLIEIDEATQSFGSAFPQPSSR
jgi:hypothetical protein